MTPAELRQRLDAHRVTQGEAAARLGITRQTLVRWLGGKTPINRANANLVRLTFPKQ